MTTCLGTQRADHSVYRACLSLTFDQSLCVLLSLMVLRVGYRI